MKRRNVQEAFIGEPDGNSTDALNDHAEGDEAVEIDVRGGKIMVVVPAGTPDNDIFSAKSFVGGEVELEDGRIFSFQIEGDAVGALAAVKRPDESERPQGLSSLPDIPSGV